jgi:hypothetical protein
MPIKHILNRGIGYSPGSYLYAMTHGLTPDLIVTPFVPPPGGGLLKKSGTGSLLKIGTHLTNDLDCCCEDELDPDCKGRTGHSPNGITVNLGTFSNGVGGNPKTTCDCSGYAGTYVLTVGGSCCAWCGGTYSGNVPHIGCLSGIWTNTIGITCQLSSRVPPASFPVGTCPCPCCTPSPGSYAECNYHKDNAGPDLYWYLAVTQGGWRPASTGGITGYGITAHWVSNPIAYSALNNDWPILGAHTMNRWTFTASACGGPCKVDFDPWVEPVWGWYCDGPCFASTALITVTE